MCTEWLKIDPQHLEAIRKMGLHIITWTLVVNPTLHLFWRWMMKLLIISLLKLVSATNGQVMRNFVVLFAVSLNKLLNRKPSYRRFETPRDWWVDVTVFKTQLPLCFRWCSCTAESAVASAQLRFRERSCVTCVTCDVNLQYFSDDMFLL